MKLPNTTRRPAETEVLQRRILYQITITSCSSLCHCFQSVCVFFFAQQFFSRQQISSSHVIYYFRILWIIFFRDSISHLRPISSRISTEFSVSVQHIFPTHHVRLFIRNRVSLKISGYRVLKCIENAQQKTQKMEMIFISNCVRVKARVYSTFCVDVRSDNVFHSRGHKRNTRDEQRW